MVIDNGNPNLSSSTRVVVTVDDVNDNAPEFLERFYKIQIPSTIVAHPESAVLQVINAVLIDKSHHLIYSRYTLNRWK